ncbi:MAG: hypothetical protein D6805_02270 [Planctomycetota bacterium]|nr:MAG: hypothetical protein D6805_02270 [Planctomycetota bacterium]
MAKFESFIGKTKTRRNPAGFEQGLQQGTVKSKQEDVLEALDVRFGHVPDELVQRIRSIEDLSQLQRLLRQAILASSLEEFQQNLK